MDKEHFQTPHIESELWSRKNFFSTITFKLYHRYQNLGRLQGQPGGQESSHCNLPFAYVGYKYVYIGGEKMIISFSKRLERYLQSWSVQSFLASIFLRSFFIFKAETLNKTKSLQVFSKFMWMKFECHLSFSIRVLTKIQSQYVTGLLE